MNFFLPGEIEVFHYLKKNKLDILADIDLFHRETSFCANTKKIYTSTYVDVMTEFTEIQTEFIYET